MRFNRYRLAVLSAGLLFSAIQAAAADSDPYTVVWDSPSQDSSGSMPLGNGDIGLNAWVEPNGDLLFYISKTDAWSDHARLLKLGKVRVTCSPPLDTKSFRQTLDVRTGTMTVNAGDAVLQVWVDANFPAVQVQAKQPNPFALSVALEPWRTAPRTLAVDERDSAYGQMESSAPIVESPDTVLPDQANCIVWYHRNESSIWKESLRHQDLGAWIDQGRDPLQHRTFGGWIQGEGLVTQSPTVLTSKQPAAMHRFSVHARTLQTPTPDEWIKSLSCLAEGYGPSWETKYADHLAWWKSFWDRSWIHLSGENTDAINQGYVLQRYITACAGRGEFPIKFNGSIFTVDAVKAKNHFDADYRQWGGPYWFQNTRLVYWPMLAAGDFEMMRPLFQMYCDTLPLATARTQAYFKHDGACFPETMYFWGAYADDNYGWDRTGKTPGVTDNPYIRYYYDGALELVTMMLEYARYTENEPFVVTTLVPFAESILTFYRLHYPLDTQGKMRIEPSQALETWQKAVNPMPPIAGLRSVLNSLLALRPALADDTRREAWKTMLAQVPDLPMTSTGKDPVLAGAQEILEEARNSENPELYAVFPYRIYGVGKPDLELARRTFDKRRVKGNEGWRQDDTQAALLGLVSEAKERLSNRLSKKHEGSRFPAFWGPNFDWIPDQDHGGNALMTLQSMLLQCQDRKILLFPAWPKTWDVDFKLHAPFNTTIEGRLKNGRLEHLQVTPNERQPDVTILEPQ